MRMHAFTCRPNMSRPKANPNVGERGINVIYIYDVYIRIHINRGE